jgi:hypothetical protein
LGETDSLKKSEAKISLHCPCKWLWSIKLQYFEILKSGKAYLMMVYQQDNRAFVSSNSFFILFFSFFLLLMSSQLCIAPAVSPAVMKTVDDLNFSHKKLAGSTLSIPHEKIVLFRHS